MTDYTKKMLLENLRKSFRHELVDMNLTRDRHNRPPLYDVKGVYVNEIESFFQSFLIASIHQAERILIMSVKEKIHTIFNYPCDCNRKMNVCECDFRDIVKILSILRAELNKD